MLSSADLVQWTYEGDAFARRPPYATATAGLWAPKLVYHAETGEYLLDYTVTDTTMPGGGSAIGVASAPSPLGPWTHAVGGSGFRADFEAVDVSRIHH